VTGDSEVVTGDSEISVTDLGQLSELTVTVFRNEEADVWQ